MPIRCHCKECGAIEMTEAEYDRQLDKPDEGWVCPKCGGHQIEIDV